MSTTQVRNVDQSWTLTKIIALVVAVITGGYMAPWAVAAVRDVRHWSVFWINLLLGWTIVGWIVALVMALRSQRLRVY
ncbi:MAG: superinfection immunity protein [Candidatus Nanopelagicales bacterium]